ncbi:MAG: DNA polymerase IV [Beduini sp.]|uniref:DNA polymerase IV n=1 Tax=Beduini sp. TaxID=1922300 RepID=UPI00399FF4B2
MPIIFHIDLNSFYASCEIARNPSLADKPVVIAGNSRRGVITTASYSARKYGVHSAMPLFQAQKLCKHLVILPVDMNYYKSISEQFFKIIAHYTSEFEIASIDECYVDVTDIVYEYENAIELASQIQKQVMDTLHIGCSIGISHNRFLSKMGSDLKKPNGITVLTKTNIQSFLWPLPVGTIHGIGKKTAVKLNQHGIITIGDFASKENYDIIKQYLGKNALLFYNRANGNDAVKLNSAHNQLQSVGNSTTLEKDTSDVDVIKEHLKRLSMQVSQRAKKRDLISNNVTITLKYTRELSINRTYRLETATNDFDIIYETALLLFDLNYDDQPIRLAGVSLSNVIARKDYSKQLSLFNYEEEKIEDSKTDEVIRSIQQQLPNSVKLTKASKLLSQTNHQKKYIDEE